MADPTYPSLASFVARRPRAGAAAPPAWAHPGSGPPALLERPAVRDRVDPILDALLVAARDTWRDEGARVGPRTFPDAWSDLLLVCRRLDADVPPAVALALAEGRAAVVGTDERPWLQLPGAWLHTAPPAERRVVLARLVAQIRTRQITARTLHALGAPEVGLHRLAGRALGPALDAAAAPLTWTLQGVLGAWSRRAELTADRGAVVGSRDPDAVRAWLVRSTVGVDVPVDPEIPSASEGSAFRTVPFLRVRLEALRLFLDSEAWARCQDQPGGRLSDGALAERTAALLEEGT